MQEENEMGTFYIYVLHITFFPKVTPILRLKSEVNSISGVYYFSLLAF